MMDTALVNPHLEGDTFFWEGGPVGVLLSHGFTATTAEVRWLAKTLHQGGYTVAGPLLPGHGTTVEEMNRTRWRQWTEAIEQTYCQLAGHCKIIFIGGESLGGVLALYAASQHPEAAGLLLYAPAMKTFARPIDILRMRLTAPFTPYFLPPPGPRTVVDERWKGYGVRPTRAALQLLALRDETVRQLKHIHQPLLIVMARLDRTVHPDAAQIICDGVSSPIKELHWMEQSTHCVILDQELPRVAELTLNFLARVQKG
jgi:carboxylesterase